MTPNEIVREIVTRLQLGGGVNQDQSKCSYWEVETATEITWNFESLDDVAEAIRAVGDGMGFSIRRDPRRTTKGGCSGSVWQRGGEQTSAFGATEAEALTRALHAYLRANRIGEEHLQPVEPEEPWIDVSESVSTANLPVVSEDCEIITDDGKSLSGYWWHEDELRWVCEGMESLVAKALGGSVIKWRYAK